MATFLRIPILAALCLTSVMRGECWALNPAKDISQYTHRTWLKKDGLPQNSVYALAQTPDGYLWIGTQEGLARFDGTNFRVYNRATTPGFKARIVRSLCVSRDSALWVGTADGSGLYRYAHGEFRSVRLPGKGSSAAVTALYEDPGRVLWVGTGDGLFAAEGDTITRRYTSADGLPWGYVEWIGSNPKGGIVVVVGGKIVSLSGGRLEGLAPALEIPWKIRSACFARDGGIWLGTIDGGLIHANDSGWHRLTMKEGLPSLHISSIEEDDRGAMWVGTSDGGIARIYHGAISIYTAQSGLSSDDVTHTLIDREGCLWVGTISGGLNRFMEGAFTTYSASGHGARNFIFSLFEDRNGSILAGSASGELFALHGRKFEVDTELPRRLPGTILAMCRDHDGSLWLGTPQGAYRVAGGQVTPHPLGFVASIVHDRDGRMWIGSMRGLFGRTSSGEWKAYPLADSGRIIGVRHIAFDHTGSMWLGTPLNGILRIPYPGADWAQNATPVAAAESYCSGNGLGSSSASSMVEDSSGTIWVSTYGSGFARLRDGKIVVVGNGGLPEDEIHQLRLDRRGFFWLSTNNGVYRVPKEAVNAFADGHSPGYPWSQFGTSSGMASDECNGGSQNASLVDRTGRIWFGTAEGAVAVDPDSLPVSIAPPAVNIEEIVVGHQRVTLGLAPLATQDRDIEFSYSAVSLSAPEHLRFRVMLVGFDKAWIDAGSRRLATYTNLSPGSYTFRVQAANTDGAWNEAGTSFNFAIEPRWFQTWWFAVLIGGVVMTVGATLHAWYRRDRDRQLVSAQLESKLTQARLQVLEMQLQPHFLFNTLNGISVLVREDPPRATAMITRLSDFLRSSLERSGVQEISLREELLFVDRYLQIELLRFADRLAVQHDIEESLLDALVPTMILQPLVENAIRHGVSKKRGPVTIRIAASRENGSLTIGVEDNGAGLTPAAEGVLKEGVGLSNTRARLQQLYGQAYRLDLTNPSTGGVTVEFTIPFHIQPSDTWNHHQL
jgi:ligand-binding sensor domain-containing protein